MASLSGSEFAEGAQYFVRAWNSFKSEPAEWIEFPAILAALHQIDGYVALSNVPVKSPCELPPVKTSNLSLDLEEQSNELLEDEATVLLESSTGTHIYDFHMVYSPAYRVPFLLLRGKHTDGMLLTEEEVVADLPAQSAELASDGRKWLFLTRQDHPYLNQPWYALHPCETAQMMKLLMHRTVEQEQGTGLIEQIPELRAKRYFLAWFSLAGPVVGLILPSQAYLFQ